PHLRPVNLDRAASVAINDVLTATFAGATEFANSPISRAPFQPWVLVFTILMLAGLVGSVTIKRRRIWIRLTPAEDGATTSVEIGGLARTDRAGWGAEFDKIHLELLGLPDPDDIDEDDLVASTGRN